MTRIELSEHTRIYRSRSTEGDEAAVSHTNDGLVLNGVLYDRLQRFDEQQGAKRGESKSAIFEWHAHYCKTTQWVGVVEVPGLQLTILPKIDGARTLPGENLAQRNLLYMLSVAGAIPLKQRDVAQLATRKASLSEALAATFAHRLRHELHIGTSHDYQSFEENIHTLRGKLVVQKQAQHNAVHRERFFCLYDEFTADTLINRIFKKACNVLVGRSYGATTKEALQSCLQVLHDVSDVSVHDGMFDTINLDRKNQRFEEILDFCRIILRNQSPNLQAGRVSTFSLLFDMNRVFEQFVIAMLRKHVAPAVDQMTIRPKAAGAKRHLMQSSDDRVLRLEPDVLIDLNKQPVLLDTKWKVFGEKVANSDLYQMYAYLKRYESHRCILLYPAVTEDTSLQKSYRLLDGNDTLSA